MDHLWNLFDFLGIFSNLSSFWDFHLEHRRLDAQHVMWPGIFLGRLPWWLLSGSREPGLGTPLALNGIHEWTLLRVRMGAEAAGRRSVASRLGQSSNGLARRQHPGMLAWSGHLAWHSCVWSGSRNTLLVCDPACRQSGQCARRSLRTFAVGLSLESICTVLGP